MDEAKQVSLRAASEGDYGFLFALYASTRQAEMALLPWIAEAKADFSRMQFEAQRKHYLAVYPNAEHSIILSEEVPLGRLYLDRQETQILIVDLTLLPQFHRQGVGRQVVSKLQRGAATAAKPLVGHVGRWNPAQVFWQRLGFILDPEDDMYYRISWIGNSSINRATI